VKKHQILTILLGITVFIIDRISKIWAFSFLTSTPLPVFYGCNLVIAWNRGVSWSMLAANQTWSYWLLVSLITLIIAFFAAYTVKQFRLGLPIGWEMLVLGGSLSNLVDRLWYKAVLDFIELYIGPYSWPVFNVADVCIVIGIGGILLRSWRKNS